MDAQKFFKTVITITLAIFLLPALIVIVFDPFFVFHKPFIHKNLGFDGTDRYQNAGLINSYLADPNEKIDTIIIGTSMSQNLPVEILKNEQGANALKITLAGGKPKELAMLLHKALKTGRVKYVVWEIFKDYASDNPGLMHEKSPLPEFLYNDNAWDNWKYIFNNDVVEEALKAAIGKKKKRRPLNELYSWENKEAFDKYSAPENIQKLKEKLRKSDLPIQKNDNSPALEFANIKQHILPFLKSNPDINFALFFPPIPYYSYALQGNTKFWHQMKMREFLLKETATMDNVHIHGFDTENWGSDLSNYMDDEHYSPLISAQILSKVKDGKNTLTINKNAPYEKKLIQKINRFSQSFLH